MDISLFSQNGERGWRGSVGSNKIDINLHSLEGVREVEGVLGAMEKKWISVCFHKMECGGWRGSAGSNKNIDNILHERECGMYKGVLVAIQSI